MEDFPVPATGLSWAEARLRMQLGGRNVLPQDAPRSWPGILLRVLAEPMFLMLLAAASVYFLLGDAADAIALLCSVVAIVGRAFYQSLRSEHALQALRELGSPRARVLRDGRPAIIAGSDIVVGDVLLLEEGDRVAADGRLLHAQDLHLDESLLTGESVPVQRRAAAHAGDGPQADDPTMVRASTLVVRGRGRAEVTAIGTATAVGGIHASMRRQRPEPGPMQREMRRAVLVFAALGIAAAALVVVLHLRTHGSWVEALLAGLTLAMANIPEEFPVVLVVFLALGAWRLARQHALVRHPPAIGTLGEITVLCTDKTGTITRNQMVVAELVAPTGRGVPSPVLPPELRALLEWGDLASPAHPHDPMELAMRAAAGEQAYHRVRAGRRVREYPFSTALAASASAWQSGADATIHVAAKGSPETMLRLCACDPAMRARVHTDIEGLAARGLRVIAVARSRWEARPGAALPSSLDGFQWTWLGLVALHDPLREGVTDAVARARSAGVRVLMLTGDHLATARAIATEAGIGGDEDGDAVLASELDALEGDAYLRRIARARVFARMRPEQKLRLVEALRANGEIVGMTGDGVNDAPSLMAADVGIAMGGRGTDVAREASELVLLDDDFVTVVDAIAAGRSIHDNIRRAVGYILAVHVPITGLALLPLALGAPLVLLPLHVVFLELIIDPASTLVFEREPPDPAVMRRPPRPASARLLDARALATGVWRGLLAFVAVAGIYLAATRLALPHAQAAAAAFIALVSGNVALIRAHHGRARNPAIAIAAAAAAGLLALVVYLPAAARWFHFAPPPAHLALAALALPWAMLAGAMLTGRYSRRRSPAPSR